MLEPFAILLIAVHGLGACLGAGGALFAEIFYAKATADGRLDRRERDWFRSTFFALRWGMTLVLISGILLVVVQYFLPNSPERVLHPALWVQNLLALVIIVFAYLLARKQITWHVGAGAVFAGWWMIFALDVWQGGIYPLLILTAIYVALVLASMAFWGYVSALARAKSLAITVAELRERERAHHGHAHPHHK